MNSIGVIGSAEFAEEFKAGYIRAMLWSEEPESLIAAGQEYYEKEGWNHEMIDADSLARIDVDCATFISLAKEHLETLMAMQHTEANATSFGHDFWLTRNGHGVGFWDTFSETAQLKARGDALSDISQGMGGVCVQWYHPDMENYIDGQAPPAGSAIELT